MKFSTIAIATLALVCGSAMATQKTPVPTTPTPTPAPTATATGIANAAALGVGVGVAKSSSSAKGGSAVLSGSFGGSAVGGAGGVATLGDVQALGAVDVRVAGSTYEAAASSAYAPAGSGPLRSCRLFIGLAGGSKDGTGSGGIPIGNDQSCLTGTGFNIMDAMNKVKPNTFKANDYLAIACKVEGMDVTQACKDLAASDTKRSQSVSYYGN